MLIRLSEYNDVLNNLIAIRAEGGKWFHSVLDDTVAPHHAYYSRDEEDLQRNVRDDDDFEHYHHFYLPALIRLMHEIKKGKIDIAEHIRKGNDGNGLIIDVQTVYLRWNCKSWLDGFTDEIRHFDEMRRVHWIGKLSKDELLEELRGSLQYFASLPNSAPLAQEWLNCNKDFQEICEGILPQAEFKKAPVGKWQTFSTVIQKNWNRSK